MATLFNKEYDDHDSQGPTRDVKSAGSKPKPSKTPDLGQLIQNERLKLPHERLPWQEIISFRDLYVHIHDMDERVKPVMIREYERPTNEEKGDWPQLHSVSKGRCPFIEEPSRDTDRDESKAKGVDTDEPSARNQKTNERRPSVSESARAKTRSRPATKSPERKIPLDERDTSKANIVKPVPNPENKSLEPSKLRIDTNTRQPMPPSLGSAHANFRGIARNPGGEPMASGMQQNITSAIRSQMVSSTAAAPGARAGTSKQLHQLNRRVLEHRSGLSANNVPSSLNMNDVRAVMNKDKSQPAPRRSMRHRAAETLVRIEEDEECREGNKESKKNADTIVASQKASAPPDPKPGYCENCREKYDDFNMVSSSSSITLRPTLLTLATFSTSYQENTRDSLSRLRIGRSWIVF